MSPAREPVHKKVRWRSFNPTYGPWYRLTQENGETISGGEALVQPDMDRSRWFWYVRVGKRDAPRAKRSGHEPTLEEAKAAAMAVFDELY